MEGPGATPGICDPTDQTLVTRAQTKIGLGSTTIQTATFSVVAAANYVIGELHLCLRFGKMVAAVRHFRSAKFTCLVIEDRARKKYPNLVRGFGCWAVEFSRVLAVDEYPLSKAMV